MKGLSRLWRSGREHGDAVSVVCADDDSDLSEVDQRRLVGRRV